MRTVFVLLALLLGAMPLTANAERSTMARCTGAVEFVPHVMAMMSKGLTGRQVLKKLKGELKDAEEPLITILTNAALVTSSMKGSSEAEIKKVVMTQCVDYLTTAESNATSGAPEQKKSTDAYTALIEADKKRGVYLPCPNEAARTVPSGPSKGYVLNAARCVGVINIMNKVSGNGAFSKEKEDAALIKAMYADRFCEYTSQNNYGSTHSEFKAGGAVQNTLIVLNKSQAAINIFKQCASFVPGWFKPKR